MISIKMVGGAEMTGIFFEASILKVIREKESDQCAAEILAFLLKESDSEYNSRQIADAISSPSRDSKGFFTNVYR